ncbi:MAG TPA: hypothetical protein VNL14_22535 [Candidatus Acidoferrales bacterium]|nr:hypothetical protein [Candidatus Acidoferrales bacterium]
MGVKNGPKIGAVVLYLLFSFWAWAEARARARFGFENVSAQAKKLAAEPFKPPPEVLAVHRELRPAERRYRWPAAEPNEPLGA